MATISQLLGSEREYSQALSQLGMVPMMTLQAFARLLEDIEERKRARERQEWVSAVTEPRPH